MKVTNTITDTFKCSLERAFRTPLHGDATKILTGYGPVPPVIGFTKDETWGIVGGSRVPIMKGNFMVKEGEFGYDEIFEKKPNEYWRWGVTQLGSSMFFAKMAQGEWWCTDTGNGTISVKWTYTYFGRNVFTQPVNWLFVRLIWSTIMKNGIKGIKQMAEKEEPYIYDR